MEWKNLKMPNGQEGQHIIRKHAKLSDEKFDNLKKDWENREIRDQKGRVRELVAKYEKKMNPRQREVISFAVEEANKILDEYEAGDMRASMDLVKLANSRFFESINRGPETAGVTLPNLQMVVIRNDKNSTNTDLADITFHELMHLFSFQRSVLIRGGKDGYADMRSERLGISIVAKDDPRKNYYREINEAITVELGMRFWKKMRENKLFKDDLWVLKNKFGSKSEEHSVLQKSKNDSGEWEIKSVMGYPEEYGKTLASMRYIYEKNKDEFKSPEEVMELFIKAYFSGKLLPVARLMEKTYGKGSFRSIAEESA